MRKQLKKIDFAKGGGVVPAVVQDYRSDQVLMLGYMDRVALRKTLETGKVWFWSRTRKKLWMKGETSGHYLHLVDIHADCDRDALLIKARPEGPTCHTGAISCFSRKAERTALAAVLDELYALVAERRRARPPDSYTTSLFEKGMDRIVQKVGEEAIEVVIAAKGRRRERTISELADLIYHLTVLLVAKGITWPDLADELARRRK